MLHVGLDLSRKRVDVHVMNDAGDRLQKRCVPSLGHSHSYSSPSA
jgi:hypothetical protein